MKKRLFSIAICFCLMLACLFSFTACSGDKMTVGTAYDKYNAQNSHLSALKSTMYDESNSGERSAQERAMLEATADTVDTFSELSTILHMLANYEAYNVVYSQYGVDEYIKKDGNTYSMIVDDLLILKLSFTENSLKLETSIQENPEAEVVSGGYVELTFAKNYIKVVMNEVEGEETVVTTAELRVSGSDVYVQCIMDEDTSDELCNVAQIKYNFTEETETYQGQEFDVTTINSFSVLLAQDVAAPASIKGADLTNYATGEGAITYTAPVTPAE